MRPAREIFMHDLKVVFVIEFVGRKDAEFVAGFKQGDGNHEDAGKRKCVALGECKILCHVRNLRPERADPAYVDGPFLQELFSGSIGSLACICPAC